MKMKINKQKTKEKEAHDSILNSRLSLIIPLLIILVLASLTYAQTNIVPQGSQWIILAGIAITTAYLVVAAVYMFAKAFNSAEFVSWSHKELFQVTATLVIVFIIIFTSAVENYVVETYIQPTTGLSVYAASEGFLPPAGQSPTIAAAIQYLTMVRNYVSYRLGTALITYTSLQAAMTSLMTTQDFFGGVVSINFEEVRNTIGKPLSSMYSNILNALMGSLGVTSAQIWFLEMINNIAFPLILPIGIVLRTTPFMRNTGSALMAIAVGFYLIYPLTFLLNYQIVTVLKEGQDWVNEPVLPPGLAAGAGETILFGAGYLLSFANLSIMGRLGVAITNICAAIPLISYMEEVAAFAIVVFAILLPILDIIITFGITRELAKLLGSDVSLDSIMQII